MHPIFCAHLIIYLGVLNSDFGVLTFCIMCVICNLNRFHSFIFELCIMIIHTLKMCTGDAGPEQILVLFLIDVDFPLILIKMGLDVRKPVFRVLE